MRHHSPDIRHQQAFLNAHNVLHRVLQGIDKGISNDLLAMDIRQALHHLGRSSAKGGQAMNDLLDNIFSKFCLPAGNAGIGK